MRFLLLLTAASSFGFTNPQLLTHHWPAQWICHPSASPLDYGVFHFRKHVRLDRQPAHFVVHVSGDNRYQLFVNGNRVSVGPARGNLEHWFFETVDIASQLHPGDNVLAAVVWNYGVQKPAYQISHQTAFLMQGDDAAAAAVNTNSSWKVMADAAYSPLPAPWTLIQPFEQVDASRFPWGWEEPNFDDNGWPSAKTVEAGQPYGTGFGSYWALVERTIPQMEEKLQRLREVRRIVGVNAPANFLTGRAPLEIPAQHTAAILLDQSFETTAYPELEVSGGRGARITITYAEALVDSAGHKQNRNRIEGMHIQGVQDVYLPDGGQRRWYRPLWFRAFRYVQIDVTTAGEPLTLNDFRGQFTAYPLVERAHFQSDDVSLKDIWEVGWRTARLCAGETYYDCPYYEQLQYVGDTRIQSLISMYVSGDDRLVRKAIQQFDESRLPGGLTQSRYPSSVPQEIPPFSLFWVDMVHDYWMLRDDAQFVRGMLIGVQSVLDFHLSRMSKQGLLGSLPWWNFVDWTDEWNDWTNVEHLGGVPQGAYAGNSSILTLQLVYALNRAAELMDAFDHHAQAETYRQRAATLKQATLRLCWDQSRRLLADSPEKNEFSQHANAMAVLVGLFPPNQARDVMNRVMSDPSLIQCTLYYRFYLYRAMKMAGLGDRYIEMLGPWRQMLSLGLTTFAEKPEPTRSDAHAWSASPNYELLASVCGIEPGKPGFRSVVIEPHLGPLHSVDGAMPHPKGEIRVELKRKGAQGIEGNIVLPAETPGEFRWNGRSVALHPGAQTVSVN